jgi:hypothetical protein
LGFFLPGDYVTLYCSRRARKSQSLDPLNAGFDPSCGRAMTRTPSVNLKLKVMRLQDSLEKHEGAKLTLIVIGLYAAIVLITYLAW